MLSTFTSNLDMSSLTLIPVYLMSPGWVRTLTLLVACGRRSLELALNLLAPKTQVTKTC